MPWNCLWWMYVCKVIFHPSLSPSIWMQEVFTGSSWCWRKSGVCLTYSGASEPLSITGPGWFVQECISVADEPPSAALWSELVPSLEPILPGTWPIFKSLALCSSAALSNPTSHLSTQTPRYLASHGWGAQGLSALPYVCGCPPPSHTRASPSCSQPPRSPSFSSEEVCHECKQSQSWVPLVSESQVRLGKGLVSNFALPLSFYNLPRAEGQISTLSIIYIILASHSLLTKFFFCIFRINFMNQGLPA